MPKKQSLEKHPQQHQLDAYGGIEAGTSKKCSAILSSVAID